MENQRINCIAGLDSNAAIIWFRNVDGAGVAQTAQLKEITLLIWLIFAIPVIIGYLIWFIVLKRKQENIN